MAINSLEKNPSIIPHPPTIGETVQKKVGSKHTAVAITLVVAAVLLIIAALVALFVLPHFGMHMTPLFGLLAIPVLVGLVKMAIAIFILHKPEKKELALEEKELKNYYVKTVSLNGREKLTSLAAVIESFKQEGIHPESTGKAETKKEEVVQHGNN